MDMKIKILSLLTLFSLVVALLALFSLAVEANEDPLAVFDEMDRQYELCLTQAKRLEAIGGTHATQAAEDQRKACAELRQNQYLNSVRVEVE